MINKRNPLRRQIESRVARRKWEDVFLTREFLDLASPKQVLRVLSTNRDIRR